ncbi:hypothetical protein RXV86_16380 [Alisedimentitalea sp. MJ-SS2]|uniref:hypothetical protein n=1 Tax=Aliisedimentitalea sp. MJ-SS2 TaxID=3049795 RepID=UPI0029146FDD|nr:hypothetical protein [Alisedimentitalea sp. MJ-SS2]MDU8928972.1 hypothetical protein [Alisedimentitalea sp. MJ-SS2]
MIDYQFENQGRSRRAAVVLSLIWGALLLGLWIIDLSPYIAAAVFAFTLPALWEFIANPRSTLSLGERHITWQSLRSGDTVPFNLIDRVRFDTRLDLSVRITLILVDSRKLRLPHACVPPHERFEEELKARGIRTERHHFSLIG